MEESATFSQEVIDYIHKNGDADPFALALKTSPFPDMEMKVIAQQILGRKIARRKFPFLLDFNQYRYPRKESLEQASSERTAKFKSQRISGNTIVDLTGGMGIDTYLLGRDFKSCTYIEPNPTLFDLTTQNFEHLGFDQCDTINTSCEDFLLNNNKKYDWAYIDPSRRIDGNRKTSVYNYEPNLVDLQSELIDLASNVMVKLSPMQDISECVSVLENVHKIWVVSVQNEVKELLLHLKSNNNPAPEISAIDLDKKGEKEFTSVFQERICEADLGRVKKYIYQPSSSIIKAELHNRYASVLGLVKLHSNTQLYTSGSELINFIGRVFRVRECISLNKKEIKRALPLMKANVITKNFPMSPQELVRKYKLKEGGDDYLIAFTDFEGKKVVALCDRL